MRRQSRRTVRSARPASFDALERRQLMAVDVTGSTAIPATKFFAADDLFDVNITLRNKGSSAVANFVPVFITVTLSKDKKLGNNDDIESFSGTVFTSAKAKSSQTREVQVHVDNAWAGGDYYVVTTVDQFGSIGESDERNNVTWSSDRAIRIVSDKLPLNQPVSGTGKNDTIVIHENWATNIVTVNGVSKYFDRSDWAVGRKLTVNAGKGNDQILQGTDRVTMSLDLHGGAGNDTIYGGTFQDSLYGDAGNDKLYGGKEVDRLEGGSGNDTLDGQEAANTSYGGSGNDLLIGVGGRDSLFGESGDDTFRARDAKANLDTDDVVNGGSGKDKAELNASDTVDGVESVSKK